MIQSLSAPCERQGEEGEEGRGEEERKRGGEEEEKRELTFGQIRALQQAGVSVNVIL